MGSMHETCISTREYYLLYVLNHVRGIESEVKKLFKSLTPIQFVKVHDVLREHTDVTIIRTIIGESAMPKIMQDFDNVIYPRLKAAVQTWKTHCIPFGTDSLVTEHTVLEQWAEESIQNLAFVAMKSLETIIPGPGTVEHDMKIQVIFQQHFPLLHAWQEEHNRSVIEPFMNTYV
jgi:hypothetical protein